MEIPESQNQSQLNENHAELAADLPLSRKQCEQIEADLNDLLDRSLGAMPRRLVAQSIYLTVLAKFLRQARATREQLAAGPEANVEAFEVFRSKMRGTPEQPWPLPLSLADKKRRSPRLRRMVLGLAHTLGTAYPDQSGRLRLYCLAIARYFRYAFGYGRLALPGIERNISWRDIGQIQFDPARPEFDELLTSYFRDRLLRSELFAADNLQWGHHLMLLHWGLIHWYSALCATSASSTQIQLEHLREGVRRVDEIYVLPAKFDKLLAQYSMMRGILDRMFQHPLYPFSMAWGEWERK